MHLAFTSKYKNKNVEGKKKEDRAKCVLKPKQAGATLMGPLEGQSVRALEVASL